MELFALTMGGLYLLTALSIGLRDFDMSAASRAILVSAATVSGAAAVGGAVLRQTTESDWWIGLAIAGCVGFPLVIVVAEAR